MTAQRAPGGAVSAASNAAPTDAPTEAPPDVRHGDRNAGPYDDPDVDQYDAVVLAGGGARRLGGADKPGVRVGGRALLDRVLGACSAAGTTVVVAGPRPTARPVVWAREEPAGAGPLAALDAGLRRTGAEQVVVLSADLPFLEERTVRSLLAALRESGADGAVLRDPGGRDQPLVAAYRSASLKREMALLAAGHDGLMGLPLRSLTARLELTRVADPVASFDCDTWDDIAAARARIREHGHVLDEWISAVKDELGIELDVDTGLLLDLARDAAHGVARPAAPLTTFLVGYAAARAAEGGGPGAVAEAARKAAALATRWAEEGGADAAVGGTPGAVPGGAPGAARGEASGAVSDVAPQAGRPGPGQDARGDVRSDVEGNTRPDAG
ncbi:molybdenum cofactor guanylyltransferase [Streptomyces longisporoflavus]|uniref:NTP transferase domain-containing protein n=1 Tax=Streptomyces longisporoflavus TaxID=28044 RepID=UPI00167CFF2C|nr:NTP transferase domain-containing protein [Streptomyces longisporoflavus]GGV50125.1 molybdenum cofactor guanylyltransferase [Streptomyces longisporoflavus]